MIYESIKSLALTLLILISVVLTWSLWTYQPQYETIEKTNNIVKEVSTNNKKEIPNLVKPSKVLFHKNDQHFGTFEESDINRMMKEIRTWEVRDIQNISSNITSEEYVSFLTRNGNIELIFPEKIPLQIYKSLMKINNKDFSLLEFDRFILNVHDEIRGEGVVYFVSNEEAMVYEAKVNIENLNKFERNFFHLSSKYPEQIEYRISDMKSEFLPIAETKMNRVQYYTDTIETDMFVEGLFTEQNIVKKDKLSDGGEVFTDGTRILKINKDQNYLQYVNTINKKEDQNITTDLIESSIDFINEHDGWTDKYRFFSWDKEEQKTVFRLYVRNFPVFNRNLTEISQVWGRNEVISYRHPLIVLDLPLEMPEYSLPSGEKVIQKIENHPGFKAQLLEGISLAYELIENDQNKQIVTLEPIWCYKYDGRWIKVEFSETDELGGNISGLE